jgi:hypothetical protein
MGRVLGNTFHVVILKQSGRLTLGTMAFGVTGLKFDDSEVTRHSHSGFYLEEIMVSTVRVY